MKLIQQFLVYRWNFDQKIARILIKVLWLSLNNSNMEDNAVFTYYAQQAIQQLAIPAHRAATTRTMMVLLWLRAHQYV